MKSFRPVTKSLDTAATSLKSLEAIVCMLTAVLVEARSKAAAHTFSLE